MKTTIGLALLLLAAATPALAWDATKFKKPSKADLKKSLTPLQYEVTQEEGTERPFKNEFHDSKAKGIYVDIVSGEPLFSSTDKYDSGTGWPSFTKPLVKENIVEKADNSLFMKRVEIRSKHGDSHLGHVFDDGPQPTGLRYCMNSASMRFIPVDKLEAEGYGEYKTLFAEASKSDEKETFVVLAGGCFWCMEPPFEELAGVSAVISGYAGGKSANPTYEQVSAGDSGHIEVVKVVYDPAKITLDKLLDVFWRNVDPTDAGGQFVDRGDQYRTAIFYADDAEKKIVEASKAKLEASGVLKKKVVTDILPAAPFYPAEDYHQDYYKTNALKYKYYRYNSGRDQFIEKTWGKKP